MNPAARPLPPRERRCTATVRVHDGRRRRCHAWRRRNTDLCHAHWWREQLGRTVTRSGPAPRASARPNGAA